MSASSALITRHAAPTRIVDLRHPNVAIASLLVAAAIVAGIVAEHAGWDRRAVEGAAIALLCLGLWATNVVPAHLTALIFFALATLGDVAPLPVVFSGFLSQAVWMLIGGMVLGRAVQTTGLARRATSWIMPYVSGSYVLMLCGTFATSVALSFVMPSNLARITILMPLVLALADRAGLAPGRPGRTGLVLTLALTNVVLSAAILPANVNNMIMMGAAQQLYGITISYGQYLVLNGPVLGIVRAAVLLGLIAFIFRDRVDAVPPAEAPEPMSAQERILCAVLLGTSALWVTDGIHHLSPAWIGLVAAAICLLPCLKLFAPSDFDTSLNNRNIFYTAALIGLAAVLDQTRVAAIAGAALAHALPIGPEHSGLFNFGLLSSLGAVLSLALTSTGLPPVFTTLAAQLAQHTGLSLPAVVMTQIVGYSTILFPYQSPPLVVALQLGNVRVGECVRLCVALAAVTMAVLVPLDFLWWRVLGFVH